MLQPHAYFTRARTRFDASSRRDDSYLGHSLTAGECLPSTGTRHSRVNCGGLCFVSAFVLAVTHQILMHPNLNRRRLWRQLSARTAPECSSAHSSMVRLRDTVCGFVMRNMSCAVDQVHRCWSPGLRITVWPRARVCVWRRRRSTVVNSRPASVGVNACRYTSGIGTAAIALPVVTIGQCDASGMRVAVARGTVTFEQRVMCETTSAGQRHDFELEPEENIVALEGSAAGMLVRVRMYTSRGRKSKYGAANPAAVLYRQVVVTYTFTLRCQMGRGVSWHW